MRAPFEVDERRTRPPNDETALPVVQAAAAVHTLTNVKSRIIVLVEEEDSIICRW
jgi:hypothetical protein